jgi:tetratricopeptide (TPR) repeat protein
VQQHLVGALFLSVWEYYDAEKIQLLSLLADSECHRTRISAVTYLLLFRFRHKEFAELMSPLPDRLRSRKGRPVIAQVQYEMLLMLASEIDMKKELDEMGALSKNLLVDEKTINMDGIRALAEMKERYTKNRLQRGLDPNLSKAVLLHHCKYMNRIAHWFLPFDKNHPLFQSVMIDDKGREKQHLSNLVDLILDCDVDKLATLYLVSNDEDFSKVVRQLDDQQIPDFENAVIPEYTFRFIMQDLYRFFLHSPVSSQLFNPFREKQTLLDFPEFAVLFSSADYLRCCRLLFEIERDAQALTAVDDLINRDGATVETLQLKGEILIHMKRYAEAQGCLRSAEILQPDNADVLRLLVECYVLQHSYEEELEYLQRLAELFPEDKSYRRLIPMTMKKMGRNEEALQLFFELDYETPEDDVNIITYIADTAFVLGKLDISERYTEKEMQLTEGKNWLSYLRMGHIHQLRGNWKNSLDCYEQFVNTFCKETGKDAKAALTIFNESQELLTSKGISREDLLLIHDILQSASDGTL